MEFFSSEGLHVDNFFDIITKKYNLCLRIEDIADRLHVSIKSAYNKRNKVIKEIIRFKML